VWSKSIDCRILVLVVGPESVDEDVYSYDDIVSSLTTLNILLLCLQSKEFMKALSSPGFSL